MSFLNFRRLFPTPKYLAPTIAGLDISDQSVKFMVLRRRRQFEILQFAARPIPAGVIEAGLIKDQSAFVKELSALRQKYDLSDVVLSLPEEEAFVVRLSLPNLRPAELEETLELQLEEHIPLPAADIVFDYEILEQRNGYELIVSAFPKKIATTYSTALTAAGLRPLAFEIEAQAIARAVVPASDDKLVMIIDFGKTRVSFFIASGPLVLFTTTANQIAGEDITKAIQKGLDLSYNEAEKLKIEEGLLAGRPRRELFFILLPIVSVLRDEIIKHYSWWDSRRSDHGRFDRPIEKVIICGGQATLPGLIEYLNLNLDWLVELANPWSNLFSFDNYIPPINLNQSLRYTTSLGLALRNLIAKHD